MTEVDYGEGWHRTRLKDQLINLCVLGCPLPPYIKEKGGGRPALARRARRSPTPTGSRIPPPFLVGLGEKEVGEREEGKGAPPPASPIRTRGRGGARPALAGPSLSPLGPNKAH